MSPAFTNEARYIRLLLRTTSHSNGSVSTPWSVCSGCLTTLRRSHLCASFRRNRIQRHFHNRPRAWYSRRFAAIPIRHGFATVSDVKARDHGPIAEYDARVARGALRNDEHQRTLIQGLQDLHEMLADYQHPEVIHPSIEDLQPKKQSFFGSLFHRKSSVKDSGRIPENLPKGLYMYGDVGSGKTMLMDLFYDTLPSNITAKYRVHFHNFMQDVHKRLHKFHMQHGQETDAIPFIAADIAETSTVLCFDEFQCTDVADAMILRRLIESLMHHGIVIVTTSNRHPSELYKNGVQRESFIPCINLLQSQLKVVNLDSTTDYRKIPRPPSGVYHHPLDKGAQTHADKWFEFLGDFKNDPPHVARHIVWGRQITVPAASGDCARFTFQDLIGRATGAADYIELMRTYHGFVITDIPGMTYRERDWARRFITFIDAVYESRAKLVLTTAVPLTQLFLSRDEIKEAVDATKNESGTSNPAKKKLLEQEPHHADVDDTMRMLMDDLGMNMATLKSSSIFSGDEERFAFARALSRLSEMGSQEWIERGLGMEHRGGKAEQDRWQKTRSRWREDFM